MYIAKTPVEHVDRVILDADSNILRLGDFEGLRNTNNEIRSQIIQALELIPGLDINALKTGNGLFISEIAAGSLEILDLSQKIRAAYEHLIANQIPVYFVSGFGTGVANLHLVFSHNEAIVRSTFEESNEAAE